MIPDSLVILSLIVVMLLVSVVGVAESMREERIDVVLFCVSVSIFLAIFVIVSAL